ncbi:MAG: dihydrofolate reductase [Candidatus Pacebacteria bacterium]|nr:dihydrofolate reductase [Candidatus Paceibacterota bacterium]
MKKKDKCLISIIAAVGNNWVVGIKNKLPWNLPADMKHFRQLTMGKPVIMGQKTFESIGKPLPGRTNIILTLDKNFIPPDCLVTHSIEGALEAAKNFDEVMICGGVSIYRQFLLLADRMYLTLIEGEFEADAYFPEFDWNDWIEIGRIENNPDKDNSYKYNFVTLERKIREKS